MLPCAIRFLLGRGYGAVEWLGFPKQLAALPEETAWELFIAAVCSTGTPNAALTWEKWPEQTQVYPVGAEQTAALDGTQLDTIKERSHASGLARPLRRHEGT